MSAGPRPGARELLGLLLDPGSFTSWDEPVDVTGVAGPYRAELAAAAQRAGTDESVLTGEGSIGGHRVALLVSEFAFLGGSIGTAAARRLTLAVERATARGLPLLAAPASGGTRMQEGTPAFLTMVSVSAAITAHAAAGLPYVVYLRHPTAGGVLASWGSLGHVTFAEPGALVGFLGPRVHEALTGEVFPAGVQTSENLHAHGVVDAVVEADGLRALVGQALGVMAGAPTAGRGLDSTPDVHDVRDLPGLPDLPAWESVVRSRDPRRPGVRELIAEAGGPVIPLHGTGAGEAGAGLLLALARFGGHPCVLLGQDRHRQASETRLGPAALRTARRGMALADHLGLPLVTVVDTPGAALTVDAEEGGLAGEIARCLRDLVSLRTLTVAVLLGEGTGGAALALLPADRVVAAQHAWLCPLPPEGASAIVHRDTDHAPQMAAGQGIRSRDLLAAGIVDAVVAEHPDASVEPSAFCRRMAAVVAGELAAGSGTDREERLHRRAARYRGLAVRTPPPPAPTPTPETPETPHHAAFDLRRQPA